MADDRLVCAGAAATPDGAAERLGAVSFALPDEPTVFGVALWADGDEPASANRYVFSTQSAPIFAAAAALATVEPVVDRIGTDAFRISCPRGLTPLIAVRADGLETYDGPYLSWGYAPFLMPGEVVRVDVSGRGAVEVSALNGGATRVSLT